eukprot:gene1456-2802_t
MIRTQSLKYSSYKRALSHLPQRLYLSQFNFDGIPRQSGETVHNINEHIFSVAPMMQYTDRHMRFLMRLITSKAVLYTEMVAANALVRTDEPLRFLEAEMGVENPMVLQLGGADPGQMKEASKIGYNAGYKEININVGCPSDKVAGAGCFGAALMLRPDLVSELSLCVGEATGRPATIKCRIGVDDKDSYEELTSFVRQVSEIGKVNHFIVHARKAVLGAKFSPDYNRKVPPLKYDFIYRLVQDFPHLKFSINGGVHTYEDVQQHLKNGVVGVMVGRSVVDSPYYWRNIDSMLYDRSRREILQSYCAYADFIEATQGPKTRRTLMKPVLNLFAGAHRGRIFRTMLDSLIRQPNLSVGTVIAKAAECVPEEQLDSLTPVSVTMEQMEVSSGFGYSEVEQDSK